MADEQPTTYSSWLDRVFHWLPNLERDERRLLFENFEAGARWNVDFVVMMGLSTALASLGLLNNSTAAVIGAMLVAPLMSPLLGGGFALVQGNVVLFRGCMQAMAYGVLVSLCVSYLLGLVSPTYEPTLEVEQRGQVNLLDLGIALVSGMAAAYAQGRPALAATLSGVAIATALVPPLAVVGIAAASGAPVLSGYAAVLFLTNMVAIVLGAAIVFRLLGAHRALAERRTPVWASRMKILLVLATAGLIIPLGDRLEQQLNIGPARAATYPLSGGVRSAVQHRVAQEFGVEIVTMGRFAFAPEAGAQVILAAETGVTPTLIPDIQSAVRNILGMSTPVRVMVLQTAPGAPPVPPAGG
jgi:uncharacterized hydrophobic protein (TIGR00271 family)